MFLLLLLLLLFLFLQLVLLSSSSVFFSSLPSPRSPPPPTSSSYLSPSSSSPSSPLPLPLTEGLCASHKLILIFVSTETDSAIHVILGLARFLFPLILHLYTVLLAVYCPEAYSHTPNFCFTPVCFTPFGFNVRYQFTALNLRSLFSV